MFVFIGFEKGGKLKSRVTPIMPRPETMIEIVIFIQLAPYYFKLVKIFQISIFAKFNSEIT